VKPAANPFAPSRLLWLMGGVNPEGNIGVGFASGSGLFRMRQGSFSLHSYWVFGQGSDIRGAVIRWVSRLSARVLYEGKIESQRFTQVAARL
jgi:hypothetical protein